MSKSLFATGLFIFIHSLLIAQVNISGKVVDGSNTQGIPFVNVSLLSVRDSSTLKGSTTDSTGEFQLLSVSTGTYILLFSSIEYQRKYQTIAIEEDAQRTLQLTDIVLTATNQLLNEVNVRADKIQIQRTDEKLVVNIADNKLFTTSSNGFDILKKLPGIQINNDGILAMAGGIVPTIFIDGKPMPMSAEQLQNYLNS
ncbi:MAG: carboxypeptidase-like regulatory domain-containing protein, partial [Flavobacterium sp.]